VASVRDDVHFAIIENQAKITAFFPYQSQGRCGQPVGGPVCDFQGVVCGPNFEVDVLRLLKAGKLHAFDFDHMLTLQHGFALHACGLEVSPRMDISQGYAAYVVERRRAGSEQIKKCGNLMRRIEREVGPLIFVPHSSDVTLLGKVLAWKSAQYVRTGQRDLFAVPWVRSLVERIHAIEARGFAGRLSLLYAGDRLVAGHFGMRTPLVWHYWFPAYDVRFAKYSPGLLLLLRIAEHAAALGATYIDLGKGMSLYKERLMNARTVLSYGSVEVPSLLKFRRTIGRYAATLARKAILNSPIEGPARRLIQAHRERTAT